MNGTKSINLLTFRNFEKEEGYCSCNDFKTNKLGTCKHLMFAFQKAKETKLEKNKAKQYPFVEIYLDPRENFNRKIIEKVQEGTSPDFSLLKAELYPYQKEGGAFLLRTEKALSLPTKWVSEKHCRP